MITIEGTTPTITFKTDTDLTPMTVLYAYIQSETVLVTLDQTRLTVTGTNVTFTLTQQETLNLGAGTWSFQLRCKDEGTVYATNKVAVYAYDVLDEVVI